MVVEAIAEGHKVQAEITHILYPRQVKHLKEENMWSVVCTSLIHRLFVDEEGS